MFSFSKKLNSLTGTATREVLALLRKGDIISFAGGVPASECLPLQEVKAAAQRVLSSNCSILQYGETEGLLELREQLLAYAAQYGIVSQTVENVLVVSGGQQGIDLSFKAFLDSNDTVLVEDPTYLAVLQMLKSYEANIVEVEAHDSGLDIVDLIAKIEKHKPKLLYIVPDFSNPTGKSYSLENRKAIYNACKNSGTIIIEDNPYSMLRFSGKSIPTIKSLDTDNSTVIFISSFSKILSPSLRVGFMLAGSEIIRKATILKQGQDLHTSKLSQAIVLEFLKGGGINEVINKALPIYRSRKQALENALTKYMPKDFVFNSPDGGLFIWGEFKDGRNTKDLLKKAIENKVAFISGDVFYAKGDKTNFIRLNFSSECEENIEKGISILGKL